MFETKREAYVKGLIEQLERFNKQHEDLNEQCLKLSRGNKSLRASLERKDEKIRGLERQTTSQRDTDARIRAEARNLGVDTFMGFSIADHVEAMYVAEELAESVKRVYSRRKLCEIARRFLKLRTPPAPKKVVTRLHCPKCEALAGEEGGKGEPTHYFCPNSKCGWRCEA